jgi:putative solute:sodium symporter small subunit
MANISNKQLTNRLSNWQYSCGWVVSLSILTLVLILLPIVFAKELATYMLLGWPAHFLIVAFGLPLFFLLIIAFYAWVMDARERDQ